MHLVVGLGNPGRRYVGTRHNVGFRVVEALAERLGSSFSPSRFQGELASFSQPTRGLLLKPTTFMNVSGRAVGGVATYHDIPPSNVLVVLDEMALELGRVRLRERGSSGGHNGLKSITQHLKTDDYPRLRIGIDRDPRVDGADWVLTPFREAERPVIAEAIERATDAVLCWLDEGPVATMNKYNG